MSTLPGQDARRPMRADARRNYERLVEQARIAFAESGVDASLDEIARRAGVASGTLYRHFPTRLDLVEAVLADRIAELTRLGRELLTAEDAYAALAAWLRATLTHALTYRGLSAAVMNSALDRSDGLASALHAQLFDLAAALLDRAARAGAIAAGTSAEDVLRLTGAIAWATQDTGDTGDTAARADRLLALLLTGLRHGPEPIPA